jgi:hypothetical protein
MYYTAAEMALPDSVQVCSLMRKNRALNTSIYTNKLANGKFRSVKCYKDECNSEALVKAPTKMGAEFKITKGADWSRSRGEGIVVKCRPSEMCG